MAVCMRMYMYVFACICVCACIFVYVVGLVCMCTYADVCACMWVCEKIYRRCDDGGRASYAFVWLCSSIKTQLPTACGLVVEELESRTQSLGFDSHLSSNLSHKGRQPNNNCSAGGLEALG